MPAGPSPFAHPRLPLEERVQPPRSRRVPLRALAAGLALACLGSASAPPAVVAAARDLPPQGIARPAPARSSEAKAAPTEYEVKAAFLYKFTRYVRWPEAAFRDKHAPLVVGVLGKDPFGEVLENTFRDHKIGERAIELRRWASLDELGPCHLLFSASQDEAQLVKIGERLKEKPVLFVCDTLRGPERGAQIGFYLDSSKVRFGVNLQSTKASALEISSELLKLAKIVGAVETLR